MKITFADHRGMGTALARALTAAGHDIVRGRHQRGEVLLIDGDWPVGHYRALCDAHPRVVLYPHGAGLVAMGDGQWPIHPHVIGQFTHGPGQADVLRRCGYPKPVEVIGWPLCPRRAFSRRAPRRVLVAPQHALGNGWLDPRLVEANRRLRHFLRRCREWHDVEITIRSIGPASALGMEAFHGATYAEGRPNVANALAAIAAADCVIGSAWTFPCLAIARGVPTLMYGVLSPDDDQGSGARHPAKTWPEYRDRVAYPLTADHVTDASELWALIEQACADDRAVAGWRDQFIGPAFEPSRFVAQFERAVQEW